MRRLIAGAALALIVTGAGGGTAFAGAGVTCQGCGWEMEVIAVIQDPVEIRDILAHLVKTGRAPPGLDPDLLN